MNRIVLKSALVGLLTGVLAAVVVYFLISSSSRADDIDAVIRFTVIGFAVGEALGFIVTFVRLRARS
jgi:ABC-type enterobactin transport system permease subunit